MAYVTMGKRLGNNIGSKTMARSHMGSFNSPIFVVYSIKGRNPHMMKSHCSLLSLTTLCTVGLEKKAKLMEGTTILYYYSLL